MTSTALAFTKGEWIVHIRHGIGRITGMDTKELLGKKRVFYVVKTESVQYWLELSEVHSGRVRPLADAADFRKALDLIASEPQKLEENSRRRLFDIEMLYSDGTLLSRAKLIRDMNARAYQKYVHVNEKRMMDNLKEQFIEEWSIVCALEEKDARKELNDALEMSCADLQPKKPIF